MENVHESYYCFADPPLVRCSTGLGYGRGESALKRTVAVINELAVRHTCRGAPVAIVHALAEALFAHFDETAFAAP